MTAEQYIETLPDVKLIFAYIECIIHEELTGAEFEDFDIFIFHKEYEDVKDQIDTLVEQARDRALVDYRITSEQDILRYYDEMFPNWENDPDLVEERKQWEEYSWYKLRQALDATYGNNWHEYQSYYFVDDVR